MRQKHSPASLFYPLFSIQACIWVSSVVILRRNHNTCHLTAKVARLPPDPCLFHTSRLDHRAGPHGFEQEHQPRGDSFHPPTHSLPSPHLPIFSPFFLPLSPVGPPLCFFPADLFFSSPFGGLWFLRHLRSGFGPLRFFFSVSTFFFPRCVYNCKYCIIY